MAEAKKRSLLAKAARSLKEAGPQRLGVTAVLLLVALAFARLSWGLPFTDNAERALFDYRSFVLAEQTQQDERILMITYDDQLLIQLQKRSPLDRGMMARALSRAASARRLISAAGSSSATIRRCSSSGGRGIS